LLIPMILLTARKLPTSHYKQLTPLKVDGIIHLREDGSLDVNGLLGSGTALPPAVPKSETSELQLVKHGHLLAVFMSWAERTARDGIPSCTKVHQRGSKGPRFTNSKSTAKSFFNSGTSHSLISGTPHSPILLLLRWAHLLNLVRRVSVY
jgi:hypothetical protein